MSLSHITEPNSENIQLQAGSLKLNFLKNQYNQMVPLSAIFFNYQQTASLVPTHLTKNLNFYIPFVDFNLEGVSQRITVNTSSPISAFTITQAGVYFISFKLNLTLDSSTTTTGIPRLNFFVTTTEQESDGLIEQYYPTTTPASTTSPLLAISSSFIAEFNVGDTLSTIGIFYSNAEGAASYDFVIDNATINCSYVGNLNPA